MRAARTALIAFAAGIGPLAHSPLEAKDDPAAPAECTCAKGHACWHYLRAPMKPPEDPCRCGACAAGFTCGAKKAPEGWSDACMASPRVACFFRRHAASWGITCSQCVADTDCDVCADLPAAPNAAARQAIEARVAAEAKAGGGRTGPGRDPILVAWSQHFYVVSDVQRHRLLTQGGAPRVIDGHEFIHLVVERSEKAWDDWVQTFGAEEMAGSRIALYVTGDGQRRASWGTAYFDAPTSTSMYGDDPSRRMSNGLAGAGLPIPMDRHGDDRDHHAFLRHMLGHMFFSRWHGSRVDPTNCPPWASAAAAEWLTRMNPLFADWPVFWSECNGEGQAASGSGDDWTAKAKVIAGSRRDAPGKLLGLAAEFHMTMDDYIRSWSWMATMLKEDREHWLAMLRLLRDGKDAGAAFSAALGAPPDEFDRHWGERLTGKRASMSETAAPGRAAPAGLSLTARLAAARTPNEITDVLRGVGQIKDAETAAAVAGAADTESDAVRETVVRLLAAATGDETLTWLRGAGLQHKDSAVRAYVARSLGLKKDARARPALESALADKEWLVRANAARALAAITDPASVNVLVAQAADGDARAWIAKADALAAFGKAAGAATSAVAQGLTKPVPPAQVAACRTLAKIGTADAIGPLIEALDAPISRTRVEALAALRALTHETFSAVAATWRAWWQKQKPQGLPPPPPQPKNPDDDRYAKPKPPTPDEPTYYGRRIESGRIVFVLDLSGSMTTAMSPPEGVIAEFGAMAPGPRIEIARAGLIRAIEKLPDRSRLNIIFFSTDVHPWRPTMVPTGANRKAAIDAVKAASADGETNIFGSLRASLGLQGKTLATMDLSEMPETVYFLTDGEPTRGEITDRRDLLAWAHEVNSYAKAKIHVIAMGSMNIDLEFLEKLAVENDGEFIPLPDR